MERKVAEKIVESFFNDMNPDFWNGKGKCPNTFDTRQWQYPLNDEVSLEITLGYDEIDGWKHFCDLVYSSNDESFDMLSGYGIDSPLNLIDTILDLCKNY